LLQKLNSKKEIIDFVSKIPHQDTPMAPSKSYKAAIKTAYGAISEEDYKWLIK